MERCNNLEQVNAQLQADSQLQREQYEKCLDKVASQVVQAILVQKVSEESWILVSAPSGGKLENEKSVY